MRRNKKTIAIVAATVILAIVAAVGTAVYLHDDGTARASSNDNQQIVEPTNNNANPN